MKLSSRLRLILPLVVIFMVLGALAPRTARWNRDYKTGSTWKYETLKADFSFPVLKSQEEIDRESAALSSSVAVPFYRMGDENSRRNLLKLELIDFGDADSLKPEIVSRVRTFYETGILPDKALQISSSQFALDTTMLYVQVDKRARKVPVSEVYTISSARLNLYYKLSALYPEVHVDSLLRSHDIYNLIAPNLIFDEQYTSINASNADNTVSPTRGYIPAGSVLVTEGELITPAVAQILNSYKHEYESSFGSAYSYFSPVWLRNAILILVMLVCLFFSIRFSDRKILSDPKRYYFILTVFAIMSVAQVLLIRFAPRWFFLFPYCVGALYLQTFFKSKVVYPVYIVSLLPMLFFGGSGVEYFMMYLAAGTVTINIFRHFSQGAKQFISASITALVTILVYFAFNVVDLSQFSIKMAGTLLVGSFFQVAAYPFIYLMERTFGLVSGNRLQELTASSTPLMRLVEQKTPGTFQHCLQVKNLASAAARAIGADELLVQAGAMYHDIGKINNPLCFVENESLTTTEAKYHQSLSPQQSAKEIMRHVTDGIELAKQYKVPDVLIDFIDTHHGTTCMSYFYDKFVKSGGDTAEKPEFCYQGSKPKTKEQVILMLSDSVEAASRTLKDYSPESVSKLVEKIFEDKNQQEQFSESDITMKEMMTVKEVLKSFITQQHHERVKYPSRKK